MKNKENVVDSVVKVTIDHTSESKQDVIQASQKLLHFLAKTTSSNSIVKKHKGKNYCCIAREKHFDWSCVTSSLNVCVQPRISFYTIYCPHPINTAPPSNQCWPVFITKVPFRMAQHICFFQMDFWPKNGQIWPKLAFSAKYQHLWHV